MHYSISFSQSTVQYLLNSSFNSVSELINPQETIIITDQNVNQAHSSKFSGFKAVIKIGIGEQHKTIDTIQKVIEQLLSHEAHRKSFILGVGGGLVTDVTGFIASTYMRGVRFGLAPTSLLGMVDAAIGGKNGVNFKQQKNLIGTINQPDFILFDNHFLDTLPIEEWSNGFSEIIKYACLFDERLFKELADNDINYYKQNNAALASLIGKCVDWKNKIVLADEHEEGRRKLLNFGHTAGHGFETIAKIPHGNAVGLGILVACKLSEHEGFDTNALEDLKTMLSSYKLPISIKCNVDDVMRTVTMDKKRNKEGIDFVLLEEIGRPVIKNTSLDTIKNAIELFINENSN